MCIFLSMLAKTTVDAVDVVVVVVAVVCCVICCHVSSVAGFKF